MSNLIASIFLIDQKQDTYKLFERLNKVVGILKELSPKEYDLFKNWFKNVVIRGIDKESHEKFEKIIRDSKEGESMVYNLEIAIREELLKSREIGIEKGIELTKQENAKKFLLLGIDVETVAKGTGLNIDKVKEIVVELQQNPQ